MYDPMMTFNPDSSILVVFCRRPALGVGKQRIAAEMGQKKALAAATLLLEATLEDARNWSGPIILSPAAPQDRAWATQLLAGAHVIPQPEGNLGTRIQAVDKQIRALGGNKIIVIGTDSPALTNSELKRAAEALDSSDAVFIPAQDGGVTLLGSSKPWPNLSNLPWETDQLGDALAACCRDQDFRCTSLETGFDIDTRKNLLAALESLSGDPRPSRIELCEWIARNKATAVEPEDEGQRVSLVIPVYKDIQALHELLQILPQLQPAVYEIIVVDGNRSNACRQLCASSGSIYLAANANRGAQLRAGAKRATGDILWFLHADSHPTLNSIQIIYQHLSKGNDSGFFRFRFTGTQHWYKRILAAAINLRSRYGVPYGDQGLFADKDAYRLAGGHAKTPLFEEVPLIKNLRRVSNCSIAAGDIGVSSRRWERDGWIRRSIHNRYLAAAFSVGVAPETLASKYQNDNS